MENDIKIWCHNVRKTSCTRVIWATSWDSLLYAIWKQQRRRSACASTQSDQRLCYSLPRQYNTSNFKPLSSFCGCAGRFESTLVANPEDPVYLMTRLIFSSCTSLSHRNSCQVCKKRKLGNCHIINCNFTVQDTCQMLKQLKWKWII